MSSPVARPRSAHSSTSRGRPERSAMRSPSSASAVRCPAACARTSVAPSTARCSSSSRRPARIAARAPRGLPASARASASAYQPRARSMAGPLRRCRAASRRCAAASADAPRRRSRVAVRMRASSAGAGQCAAASVVVTSTAERTSSARAHPSAHRARSTRSRASAAHSGRCWRSNSRAARRACGKRGRGVVVEQGRLGEDQPGLRQLHVPPAAGVLRDGLLRRLPCLAGQPHREQQLGAVDEQLAQPAVLLADAPLGDGRVGEGGRGLAAQAQHPGEVGVGEPDLQRQRLVPRQPLGLAQVRLRGGELVPEGVGEPAVPDHPPDPERVARPAQRRQRLAVVVEGLPVPAQVEQHPAALRQGAGPAVRVVEQGQHPVELVERLRRAPALGEQEGHREPGRGRRRRRAGLLGAAEAALQVGQRAVEGAAVPQRLPPGLFGDGPGHRVAPPAGPAHRRGRQHHGLRGRRVGQPQRLLGGVEARPSVHASIPVPRGARCQRGFAQLSMYQSICWPLLLTGFLCGGPATRRWVGWLRTSASARSSSRRSTWTSSAGSSAPACAVAGGRTPRLGLTLVTLANAAEAGRALARSPGRRAPAARSRRSTATSTACSPSCACCPRTATPAGRRRSARTAR